MAKERTWKFWVTFWLCSAVLLTGWFFFLKVKSGSHQDLIRFIQPLVKLMPASQEKKVELGTVLDIAYSISSGEEKTFLILFQNNHELRPGGGYIGSFGILKIKDKEVTFVDTHDTNVFDSGLATQIEPPFPMGRMLNIADWELRDSNWSPDFPTNAAKAEEFYQLEGGQEQLDGVVAISTEILPAFLEVLGPVTVEGYEGEYNSQNAIEKLQYEVERGYKEKDLEKGKRKYIMKDLSRIIMKRASEASLLKKKALADEMRELLNQKSILIYFKDNDLQDKVRSLGWSGEVKGSENDYLMLVDANLGAYKTDAVLKRSFEYTVDFRNDKPWAKLIVKYDLIDQEKDWRTSDYNGYLRVYTPEGSWLYDVKGVGDTRFGNEFGKKYFGFVHQTKLGQTHQLEIDYDLPENITEERYQLMIQKQSGMRDLPGKITVVKKDGSQTEENITVDKDLTYKANK